MWWQAQMMYLLISCDSIATGLFLIILYYIIFLYLILLSLYIFSTVLISLQSDLFDSTPVFNSSFTHTVCLRCSHWASIILSSFLEIPTSTWEACSTASTSRWFLSPPSSQVVMYVLKNGWHFNAKAGREDIFKPTIGNENLHEISNCNGGRLANFAKSKNLIAKSTMFPHHNIHKFTWNLLMERHTTKLTIFW
jgi:hypothetical protein